MFIYQVNQLKNDIQTMDKMIFRPWINSSDKKNLFFKFDPVHLSIYGHKFVSSLLIEKKIVK